MSGAEQRSDPRLEVNLDAIVHPERGRTWSCTIRDFCIGGMMLMGENRPGRSLVSTGFQPRRDDVLHVHFSVPGSSGHRNFRLTARVARSLENGMGVYFPDGMAVRAFQALEEFAESQVDKDKDKEEGDQEAMRDARLSEVQAEGVRKRLRLLTSKALPQLFKSFFQRAQEELVVKARDAASNADQNRLFEALSEIESKRSDVSDEAGREVLFQLDEVLDVAAVRERRQNRNQSRDRSHLSLVDTDQFESWLLVSDTISAAEAQFSEELFEMRYRLGMLARPWAHKDVTPVGPTVIAVAFEEAIRGVQVDREVRELLFRFFRDALLAFLRQFYKAVAKMLEDTGVFPPIEEAYEARRDAAAQPRPAPQPAAEPEEDEAWDESFDEPLEGARYAPQGQDASGPGQRPPPPRQSGSGPAAASQPQYSPQAQPQYAPQGQPQQHAYAQQPAQQGGQQGAQPYSGAQEAQPASRLRDTQELPALDPGLTQEMPAANGLTQEMPSIPRHAVQELMPHQGNVYSAARELMGLQRSLQRSDQTANAGASAEAGSAAGAGAGAGATEADGGARLRPEMVYSRNEIVAALDRLSGSSASSSGVGVRERVMDSLAESGDSRALAPDIEDALSVVDGLLGSVRQDTFVPESVKSWMDQLEITYGKLATENAEFLDTSATPLHPALQLLNGLAEIGNTADAGEGMDQNVRRKVDAILQRVAREYDGEPAVFERALGELEPLVQRQQRAFEGNKQRAVRQSEGQHRLVQARRSVVDELDERLAGKDIPELIIKLLNPGWRNLLVHSHLRHGQDSSQWQDNMALLDELVGALEDPEQDVDVDELVGRVAKGLESIAYEPGRRRQLVNEVSTALRERHETTLRRVSIDPEEGTKALIGLADQLPDADPAAPEDQRDPESWERWLKRARELELGNWLSVDDEAGRPRILTIAWIGEDHAAFTLVNRKGVKVHDFDLKTLTRGLVENSIAILDEFDLPLMERASQRMLQNMHNQLAYQASHDALTGLINRKQFEHDLAEAVQRSEGDESDYVVMQLDLDQFKVINNTVGHEAGDDLLRALVPRLRHEIRGTRSVLARLGGDEFGLLLERCEREQGMQIARNLLKSVAEFVFERDDREFRTTVSIGFVAFTNDGRDASTLMQNADAACWAAKEGGRARLQVFETTDTSMLERKGVMEWVAEVDRRLKENMLQLTAQRIAPIRNPGGSPPHYEILLRVLDDNGKPEAPSNFIQAAETYGRMPDVDRWVVRNALNWMSLHLKRLDEVHGFSINLSGTSLGSEGFLEFVIKQITMTRVPTDKITFEVTETAAIASMDGAARFMNKMRQMGCSFSLDDFGTGLSSYSYLRNLPVDYVKIDGVFVKDICTNPADYAVVRSVNEVAHFMGKKTIAEFVENNDIIDKLREIGVDYAQGFGIHKPEPLDNFFK